MPNARRILIFLRPFLLESPWSFGFAFVMSLIWSLDAILWPYIVSRFVDIFTLFETNRHAVWGELQGPIALAFFLIALIEGGYRTMGLSLSKALPKLEASVRMSMFDHVQRHSPRYFNENFSGALANKIGDFTNQMTAIIGQMLWPILPSTATCILGVVVLWHINPLLGITMALWIAVHLGVSFYFTKPIDDLEHAHSEAKSTLMGKIVDSLTNNFAVNLFFRFAEENRFIRSFQAVETKLNERAKYRVELLRGIFSIIFFIGCILGLNGALIVLWTKDLITTGQAVQVFTTGWNLTMVLWSVSLALPQLFQSYGTLKQAFSVMEDRRDINDQPNAQPLQLSTGMITFDNVFFSYGKQPLFQGLHAHIEGGERVGLVGFTGAGKSTFVNLVLRFFPVDSGTISIDGQSISKVTLESLRRSCALIPQEPLLFHRSLKENILFGNPTASDDELYRAARLAHCDEFIRKLPLGYDSKVGERGTKLSGGEKQRVAIARAILADAPILILDEATSSLDSLTERYIQESLDLLMQNRTTLVIAHRLSTLARMDRILVFDKGAIVEEGSHAHLLKQDGLYAKMWAMQVGGFLPERE